jgi:hypothetical protein
MDRRKYWTISKVEHLHQPEAQAVVEKPGKLRSPRKPGKLEGDIKRSE